MRRNLPIIAAVLALSGLAVPALAAEHEAIPHQSWSFAGPFGTFDQASLQRGYKVYREVCGTCHTANLLSFRNLGEKYGPFWDEKYPNPNDNPYVKAIAADFDIKMIDEETGDADAERKGTPADRFPDPFPNEYAARASTGGALPPDLSLIVKAREGGANYVYALLTGFEEAPAGVKLEKNMSYNKYFPGHQIAMKPPLTLDKVTFDDGTKSTVAQQAKDVTTFLAWASEPKQIERKRVGMWVMIYLIGLAALAYASYRRVWKNESH